WESETGSLVRTLSGHSSLVLSVSYSPDGKFIASGSSGSTVKVWESETGSLVRTLSGHSSPVWSVSYSPDGKFIASGSDDSTVKVWESETGTLVRTLSDHSSLVLSVGYSPDGKFIASGSYDKTVKVWESKTGSLVRTLSGHSSTVLSVSYSPDGKFIASRSYDNTMKVWDIDNGIQKMAIALLPSNEWITWQPGKLFYNSSLQGDEYAAVRFDNKTYPVYPLRYYRKELQRKDWKPDLPDPTPKIKPRWIKLWWDELPQRIEWQAKYYTTKFIIICLSFISGIALTFVLIMLKRTDPFEVSKRFFVRTGFEKADPLSGNLLLLHAEKTRNTSMVSVWHQEKSNPRLIRLVEKYEKNPDKQIKKLYLIYSDHPCSPKTMQDLREQTKCEIISIQSSRMKKALYSDTCQQTLKELEEPFITRTDPYTESKPIKDITWFYGRNSLMNLLPALLAQGQHIGVFGLRKVGKTSLIKQIQQRFAETPTILIDCQIFSSKAEIYFEEILKQLRNELRTHEIKKIPELKPLSSTEDFISQFTTFFELWKKTGRHEPFIIILDEIDKFFPDRQIKENHPILTQYVQFFKVLRGLAQTSQCLVTMVVAYRPDVNRHNLLTRSVGENPMFKSFQEEYLGFLSHTDSTMMIHEIGLWKDIRWEHDAAQRVFYYCGGHPLVTRYFASQACNEGSLKYIDYEQVENTAMEILDSFHLNDIGNYYKEGIWEYLNENEREVLSLVCQENISSADIPKELKEALASLQHFGLLANENGRLCLTANLFYEWLKETS
ncbi:MAG: AAA family ATPase, partial [Desulfobacterales bacterium]|nr:AAA family ATPase [Desulfobacterales bacterium]